MTRDYSIKWELGLRGGTVINAATKGIKRYDHMLCKEEQEK
jgi:hypothetical protein